MIGTNPELMKLEINKFQDPPSVTNMGFSIVKSWDNAAELSNWTLALTGIDGFACRPFGTLDFLIVLSFPD